jgi:hypothetical protein
LQFNPDFAIEAYNNFTLEAFNGYDDDKFIKMTTKGNTPFQVGNNFMLDWQGNVTIRGGSISIYDNGSLAFGVTSNGALTATNANIMGIITASSGAIGNWKVNTDGTMTNGVVTLGAPDAPIKTTSTTYPLMVDSSGQFKTKSSTLESLTVTSSLVVNAAADGGSEVATTNDSGISFAAAEPSQSKDGGPTTGAGSVVSALAAINGDTKIDGNTEITGTLKIDGVTSIGGDTDITGTVAIDGDTDITGIVTIGGDTDITGTVAIGGSALDKNYDLVLLGDINIGGSIHINGRDAYANGANPVEIKIDTPNELGVGLMEFHNGILVSWTPPNGGSTGTNADGSLKTKYAKQSEFETLLEDLGDLAYCDTITLSASFKIGSGSY